MSLLSKPEILSVLNDSRLELKEDQISDEIIERFQEFCAILHKWNDKINLTSEKTALSILEKHIFDSLQYLRWIDSSCKTLDIGSGAGFPGIPIKIIHSKLDLTLMDSQRKRCNFLREAIRSLGLEGIEVLEGRAEDFASRKDLSAKFDRVCFRGFSSLSTCIATGLPFLKPGGRILLKKSPDEMPDSTHEIHPNACIIGSKEVDGFRGQNSLMMVVEKRST
jgi:16S rRNA (guanine527-N7)-methyltransferase